MSNVIWCRINYFCSDKLRYKNLFYSNFKPIIPGLIVLRHNKQKLKTKVNKPILSIFQKAYSEFKKIKASQLTTN